jgi:hypothetical protein
MEIIKTMGGTLTYSPGNHRYAWNGSRVDFSVSAVASSYPLAFGSASGWAAKMIKLELLRTDAGASVSGDADRLAWAKEICKAPHRSTKRAGDIGTEVHRYVEDLAHGLNPELSNDEDIAKCQTGIGEWFASNIAEVIDIERRLYSLRWQVAGTCDMVARLNDGKTYVLDWKGVTDLSASVGVKHGHVGQLTAYRHMLGETGEQIDGCLLVRFSRATGEVEATLLRDHDANVAAFAAALHLARYAPQTEIFSTVVS